MLMIRPPAGRSGRPASGGVADRSPAVLPPASHPPLPAVSRPSDTELVRVSQVLATWDELWDRILVRSSRPWSTRLAGGEGWEAWLWTWPPSCGTGWYDPGPSSTAFALLRGELLLRTGADPDRGLRAARTPVLPGDARLLRSGTAHELVNPGLEHATSLHVHSPVPPPGGHGRVRHDGGTGAGDAPERPADPGDVPVPGSESSSGPAGTVGRRTGRAARPRNGRRSRIG